MAKLLRAVFTLGVISSISCTPTFNSGSNSLKEIFHPPGEWRQQRPAPPDQDLTLRISLSQPSLDTLTEHLYAVSDPSSPRYGHHLSKHQLHELSAPHPHSLSAVDAWLAFHGFDVDRLERSPSMDWVKLKTSVRKAEDMLNTTYHVWENSRTGESIIRTTRWSVPEHLKDHIDLVHPTTMFGTGLMSQSIPFRLADKVPGKNGVQPLTNSSSSSIIDPSCNETITPACLLTMYNATDYKVQAADKGNKIAIASYLEEFANLADLQTFYENLVPAAVNSSFKVVSINGGKNDQSIAKAGLEANLDAQYAFGLTYPTPATVFTTGGLPPFITDNADPTNTNEPYLDWLDVVLAQDDLPQTISTSYADREQTVPFSFAKTACNGFARLGARGVSIIFASGDDGVGDGDSDPATTVCQSNDGTNRTEFLPMFPASCPFVTSVGGTVPEVAVTSFGSGGGFSTYFARPAYQDDAVKPFLKSLGNTYNGLFNPHGRGIPDVAAQGDNYLFWYRGQSFLIGGTSAASPTFAGLVTLLNDARIAAGQPPLGFLNPLIYKNANSFNDITVGNNPGCGTPGFQCRVGWDPVTGVGTPNFNLLKNIVLKD